jgi:hypothetical protein
VFFLPRLATSNVTTVIRIDGGFFYVQDVRNRTDSANRMKIVNVETMTAVISVKQNNSSLERIGTVRFTNGYVTKNFVVRQLGGTVIDIHHDETILNIETNEIMRSFIQEQLTGMDNDEKYSNSKFLDGVQNSKETEKLLYNYQKNFYIVIEIINKIIKKFKETIDLIPYTIKYICKIISISLKKKFKGI